MREHQFIIVMALIIAAGMFGLYQVGITSQIGLTCRNCAPPTFINLTYYQEKFFQIFTFVPFYIFNKLNLELTQNYEIDSVIGLTIAFFLFFFAITTILWICRFGVLLLLKDDPTERDNS